MQVFFVIGCNLFLSLLLLILAGWLWQWHRHRYLRLTTTELGIAVQETQIALKQATLHCQKQQLTLLQTRYQYQRLQKYKQQLQQLGELISLVSWLGRRITFGTGQR